MILFTSQESMLLLSAATNGGSDRWSRDDQAGVISYTTPGLPGRVRIESAGEDLGATVERLRRLHPDSSAIIAWCFNELVGDPLTAVRGTPNLRGVFSLSRIIHEALGVDVWRVDEKRRKVLFERVTDALWFATRARVECERTYECDMGGGKKSAIKIAATPFLVQRLDLDVQRPVVEIHLSIAWHRVCVGKSAQFVNVGDAFSRITSARPGGSLARALALWLAQQGRINKGECLAPVPLRTILERFGAVLPMKRRGTGERARASLSPDLLAYWVDALHHLAEIGLVAPCAVISPEVLHSRLGITERGESAACALLDAPVTLALGSQLRGENPLKLGQQPPITWTATPYNLDSGRGSKGTIINNKLVGVSGGSNPPPSPPLEKDGNTLPGLFAEVSR